MDVSESDGIGGLGELVERRDRGCKRGRCEVFCYLTTPHKLQAEARSRKRAGHRPVVYPSSKPMAAGVSASCGS